MLYVLACGSRTWTNTRLLGQVLDEYLVQGTGPEVRLLHGDARGADRLAGAWAKGLGLRVKAMPAEWDRLGKAAGAHRNQAMLDLLLDRQRDGHVVRVVAFAAPDLERSRGTADMVRRARAAGLEVEVVEEVKVDACF